MVHKIHGSVRCDAIQLCQFGTFSILQKERHAREMFLIFSNVLFIKTKCFTLNNDGT